MDVHQYLYADSSPVWGTSFSDIYDSAIHWTDRNVGLLMEGLERQGLLSNTLVVIASDHGEGFFEHGQEGHARTLYREVQHVPFIIIPPFGIDGGLVVEERVANVDVWPTILDMVGLPPMPGADGQSLMPLVMAAGGVGSAPRELVERPLFAHIDKNWGRNGKDPDPLISVLQGDHRFLSLLSKPEENELYDRSNDPTEQKNLLSKDADADASLLSAVESYMAIENTLWGEAPEIELDEMKKAQLRALGYVLPETGVRKVRKGAGKKAN